MQRGSGWSVAGVWPLASRMPGPRSEFSGAIAGLGRRFVTGSDFVAIFAVFVATIVAPWFRLALVSIRFVAGLLTVRGAIIITLCTAASRF